MNIVPYDDLANVLGRGPGPVEVSSEDNGFTREKLYDHEAQQIFAFTDTTDQWIKKDTNLIADPGVTGGAAWVTASLVVGHSEGGEPITSTYLQQDVEVTPGEPLRLEVVADGVWNGEGRPDLSVVASYVKVQNIATGRWLKADSSIVDHAIEDAEAGRQFNYLYTAEDASRWVDDDPGIDGLHAFTGNLSLSPANPESYTVDFRVEPLALCRGRRKVKVRVMLFPPVDQNAADLFYRVQLLPSINLVAVFGHNLGPVAPTLQASDDGAPGTLGQDLDAGGSANWGRAGIDDSEIDWRGQAALTVDQPAFYARADPFFARYVRLFFAGTNDTAAYIGEAFIGRSLVTLAPRWGWKEHDSRPQVRHTNDAGQTRAYAITAERMRGLTLDFTPYSANGESVEALEVLRREVWGRTEGGAWPVIVIPRDSRADVVLGLLAPKLDVTQMLPNAQETAFTIEAMAGPIVGA